MVLFVRFRNWTGRHLWQTEVPIYCLNVTYPLVNDEFLRFCEGKSSVMVEEGAPDFIEQADHNGVSLIARLNYSAQYHFGLGLTGQVMLDSIVAC